MKVGKKDFPRKMGNSEDPLPNPLTETLDTVWLRVKNNSKWELQFTALSTSMTLQNTDLRLDGEFAIELAKNDGEFQLVYYVSPINSEVATPHKLDWTLPYRRLFGSESKIVVRSGGSAIFVVRREELERNLQISLPFKYEWEWTVKDPGYGEPEHRASLDWATFEKVAGIK